MKPDHDLARLKRDLGTDNAGQYGGTFKAVSCRAAHHWANAQKTSGTIENKTSSRPSSRHSVDTLRLNTIPGNKDAIATVETGRRANERIILEWV
jgi:hypothetical protein